MKKRKGVYLVERLFGQPAQLVVTIMNAGWNERCLLVVASVLLTGQKRDGQKLDRAIPTGALNDPEIPKALPSDEVTSRIFHHHLFTPA